MVKLFGWEKKMSDNLQQTRDEELHWLFKEKVRWFPYVFPAFSYIASRYLPYWLGLSSEQLRFRSSSSSDVDHSQFSHSDSLDGSHFRSLYHDRQATSHPFVFWRLTSSYLLLICVASKIFSSLPVFDGIRGLLHRTNWYLADMIRGKSYRILQPLYSW